MVSFVFVLVYFVFNVYAFCMGLGLVLGFFFVCFSHVFSVSFSAKTRSNKYM